jgi:glycosyltransferase involved in cell wall biosynthesis
MKLLIVSAYYPEQRGGIEVVSGYLAEHLAAAGVEVVWAASDSGEQSEQSQNGTGITRLPMRSWDGIQKRMGVPWPVWSVRSLARLRRAISECDVVHLHDTLYLGNILAATCCALRRRPLLVTQHIFVRPYRSATVSLAARLGTHLVTRQILKQCDQAVFISTKVLSSFRTVRYRREPVFIPNGVDHARFNTEGTEKQSDIRRKLDLPLDRPIILFAGRFTDPKGLPLLRRLAERCTDYLWHFVGRGTHDPSSWGLPNVICRGPVQHDEMDECYRSADLLILPAAGEGFPLVVQEAMACGTPVLVADGVVDGFPGAGDVVLSATLNEDAMCGVIRSAMRAPQELRALGLSGASFARTHFCWQRCVDSYLAILESLVKMKGSKQRPHTVQPICKG